MRFHFDHHYQKRVATPVVVLIPTLQYCQSILRPSICICKLVYSVATVHYYISSRVHVSLSKLVESGALDGPQQTSLATVLLEYSLNHNHATCTFAHSTQQSLKFLLI